MNICFIHLESISVKRLQSVETLVSPVMFPVAPDPGGPGELGDDPRHGQAESLKVGPPSNDTDRDTRHCFDKLLISLSPTCIFPHLNNSIQSELSVSSAFRISFSAIQIWRSSPLSANHSAIALFNTFV